MNVSRLGAGVLTAALLVGAWGTLASGTADAHGRGRVGVFVGFPGPFYYPGPAYYPYPHYYYPPAYYPPPTVVVPPPAEYIEQNPPAASPPMPSAPPSQSAAPPPPSPGAAPAPSQQGPGAASYSWYFCPDSQTYYPYVQTCASQWQQVAPRPPVPPS